MMAIKGALGIDDSRFDSECVEKAVSSYANYVYAVGELVERDAIEQARELAMEPPYDDEWVIAALDLLMSR